MEREVSELADDDIATLREREWLDELFGWDGEDLDEDELDEARRSLHTSLKGRPGASSSLGSAGLGSAWRGRAWPGWARHGRARLWV